MKSLEHWKNDDLTFCTHPCKLSSCLRHPASIRNPDEPHSYADMYASMECPRCCNVRVRKVKYGD